MAQQIPKTFHQIWLGDRPLPTKFQAYQAAWLAKHPDWKLQLWTDEHLPTLKNEYEFRHSAVVAGQADILRYELIEQFGGVYLDVDIEPRRSIEPLLDGVQAFVAREDARWLCNAVLGGVPRHPLFAKLVELLPRAFRRHQHADGRYDSGQSGPVYLTRTVRRCLHAAPGSVRVFPPRVFFPYPWHEPWREHESHPAAYAVHHWSYSWIDVDSLPPRAVAYLRQQAAGDKDAS